MTRSLFVQVLLVAGGKDGSNNLLSSTEILDTVDASNWRTVTELPYKVTGLCGATLNNIIYMSGEWCTGICIMYVLSFFRGEKRG